MYNGMKYQKYALPIKPPSPIPSSPIQEPPSIKAISITELTAGLEEEDGVSAALTAFSSASRRTSSTLLLGLYSEPLFLGDESSEGEIKYTQYLHKAQDRTKDWYLLNVRTHSQTP